MLDSTPTSTAGPPASEPATIPATALGPSGGAVESHGGLAEIDPWRPAAGDAPPRQRSRLLAHVSETLEVVALALIMFLAVRSVGQNFIVDGSSMLPSFEDGQLLIVNRLAYQTFDFSWIPGVDDDEVWRPFGTPQPGEVIVFQFPRGPERDFIKRVIAGPGQTVAVHDGAVYVDGERLDEPYLDDPPTYDYPETRVPPEHIFVLGDNRNNSYDSHAWGMLDTSLIIGRADLRYWPLSDLDRIDHMAPEPGPVANASGDSSSARSPSAGAEPRSATRAEVLASP